MKRILAVSCLILSTIGFARGEETVVAVNDVFIPKGFDGNDDVEIVLSGEFPNTCYQRPKTELAVRNGKINVDMKAEVVRSRPCIMAVVPYLTTVKIGRVGVGTHEIVINPGHRDAKIARLNVEAPGSASIDNFTYANVTAAEFNGKKLVLSGYHPSSCMKLDRVAVDTNDNRDTVSVMPIIYQDPEFPICDAMIAPFTYEIELPELAAKRILAHVRKLDGNALNFLIKK